MCRLFLRFAPGRPPTQLLFLGPVSASVPFYNLLSHALSLFLYLSLSLLPSPSRRRRVHNEPLSLCILMTFRRCLLCELIFVAAN